MIANLFQFVMQSLDLFGQLVDDAGEVVFRLASAIRFASFHGASTVASKQ